MSEEKKVDATQGAQSVAKKNRRGVNNSTQAVSQMRFHENDADKMTGLFKAHLHGVTVEWSENAEAKNFAGLKVPRLVFHFASNHPNVNEQRHVYQTLFPVESNVNTIPGGDEEWKVNSVLNWIKHMLDVFYLKGRELTPVEEDALTLPFEDFDETGAYVAIDAEEVLKGYQIIFENAAGMLNGTFSADGAEVTGKACYKTTDGKFIPCYIKLLRARKRKNEWFNVDRNGELAFDSFIGNGCVELMKGQNPPAILRLDLSKESIVPKETKKAPSVGIPGMPMAGSVMAGMPADMGAQPNNAYAEAAGDMPF